MKRTIAVVIFQNDVTLSVNNLFILFSFSVLMFAVLDCFYFS